MSIATGPASLIRPGDKRYDPARQAFNLTVDQRPVLVAQPADEWNVIELVRYAREAGLRVAPQRTGHNAGPIDWQRPAMLLRTDAMQGVEIDAANRRARVRGGARWLDLIDDLSEMGLGALHGSARDIGIAGYSLGGGVGWLGRKHGLQTNNVTAIELVTADGELVRADHDNEPELSGRCAAAAATSASSRRSSSTSTRCPSCTPARCSSPSSGAARCCTPGTSGRRACRTRSPRSGA